MYGFSNKNYAAMNEKETFVRYVERNIDEFLLLLHKNTDAAYLAILIIGVIVIFLIVTKVQDIPKKAYNVILCIGFVMATIIVAIVVRNFFFPTVEFDTGKNTQIDLNHSEPSSRSRKDNQPQKNSANY